MTGLLQLAVEDKLKDALIRKVNACVRGLKDAECRLSGRTAVVILVIRRSLSTFFLESSANWRIFALNECDWVIIRMDESLINAVDIRRTFHRSNFFFPQYSRS